jgi:aminopeptidase N
MKPTRHVNTLPVAALVLAGLSLALGGCSKGCWSRLHQVPGEPDENSFTPLSHGVLLELHPDDHHIELVDTLYYEGIPGRLTLHRDMKVTGISFAGKPYPVKKLIEVPSDDDTLHTTWQFCRKPPAKGPMVLRLEGTLYQDPANMVFGHEKVGQELSATIGPEGAWLAGWASVLPVVGEEGLPLRLTADIPEAWSLMSHGRLVDESVKDGRRRMVWHNEVRGHSPDIVAGQYRIRREEYKGVSLETWFLEHNEPQIGIDGKPVDDAKVEETLQRMNRYYLDMYTELVGEYPFDRFSVVETFFPSGYGMPGWTLLGSQVIRMPYIPYTSLGHEMLHNWWGNSVQVDPTEGNWCEGLTVYQADYRYKNDENPDAGRAYRKDTLKAWLAYTRTGSDLPLSEFRNRHDGATRAVGYGKSLMVFVMLEDLLGRETLEAALRDVYRDFRGRAASWSDLLAACESRGRTDLKRFARQWLHRTGAPQLSLAPGCAWDKGVLRGELVQDSGDPQAEPYELDVRLEITCHDGTVLQPLVYMDGARQVFEVECPEPKKVIVDPDVRLFRRMHEGEIEAIISMVMAGQQPLVVAPDAQCATEDGLAALRAFGSALYDGDVAVMRWSDYTPAELETRTVLFVSPPTLPEGLEPVDLRLVDGGWQVAGNSGTAGESSLVLALKNAHDPGRASLVIQPSSPEQLAVLARKVPHYGKYSLLAFDPSGTNILKQNLEPRGNPLEVRFGSW